MPSSALHLAHDLLLRQVGGEQLSDRELGRLDVLMAATSGKVLLPPDPVDVPDIPADRRPADAAIVAPAVTSSAATGPKPTAEPDTCPHCHKSPTAWAAMRTERPDVWSSLHWDHPDERARRDDYNAAVMRRTLGVPSPWL